MSVIVDTFDVLAHQIGCGCGSTPYLVGKSVYKYTACGPWTEFLVRSDQKRISGGLYYEDVLAQDRILVPLIVGIRIGSIVEGSNVDVSAHTLVFPFDVEKLERTLKSINEEASFYWVRDNSDWFTLLSPHGKEYQFRSTAFEEKPVWVDEKPRSKKILDLVEYFVYEDYPGLYGKDEKSGARFQEVPEGTYVKLYDTNWQVKEWINNDTYC